MNKFRGWKTVFGFTFKKSCGKGYKAITTLIALLIIGALVLVNVLIAKPDKEEEPSDIKTVSVIDQSGLNATDFSVMVSQLSPIKFKETKFEVSNAASKEEAAKTLDETTEQGIVVVITKTETGYCIEAAIPSKSTISTGECEDLLEVMTNSFQANKLVQAGLTTDQLVTVLKPIQDSYQSVGEDTNLATVLVKMLVPMFFGFVMYFLIMLHGQNVSKTVSTEKTSKLMETLLTSIHPYALITGKVLAIASVAIIQFLAWVAAAIVGLYGGNIVAHSIYPEYESTVVTIINFFRDNIGETALTLQSVILAIIIFCIGFLFYCVLAGLAGGIVSKPEDVASAQGLFIFPMLISWLVCYFGAAGENTALLAVARFIPFTIPFGVPVDLMTGTVSILQGIISLVILLLFSILIIMLSARIYRGLVLYNGEKVSFKKLVQIIKAKQ